MCQLLVKQHHVFKQTHVLPACLCILLDPTVIMLNLCLPVYFHGTRLQGAVDCVFLQIMIALCIYITFHLRIKELHKARFDVHILLSSSLLARGKEEAQSEELHSETSFIDEGTAPFQSRFYKPRMILMTIRPHLKWRGRCGCRGPSWIQAYQKPNMLVPVWVILPGEDEGESKSLLWTYPGSSPAKQEQEKCAGQDGGRSG